MAELAAITKPLYESVFEPLEKHLNGSTRILISPDGSLNLLPFELLACSDNKNVIEKYEISYLSSGRDLLKPDKPQIAPTQYAVTISDPDFFNQTRPSGVSLAQQAEGTASLAARGPSDRASCLNNLFRPLPFTGEECQVVSRLLSQRSNLKVRDYSAAEASEAVLKNLPNPPNVLHLATHGYYCANMGDNPLLYSGLVFAGANNMVTGEAGLEEGVEDGILTALEASGLNLMGTDLVVLSSCQSGAGEVVSGEGVYGLRRAFQHAGARTVIMSMFDIPDQAAASCMELFYRNWTAGATKSQALRQASLSLLDERRKEHGVAHPMYWGGFILVGDPN